MYQPTIRKQWSPARKKAFFAKHLNMCDGCHTGGKLEIHHIVPLALGGLDDETNCSAVCHQCHDNLHKYLNNKTLGITSSGRKPKYPDEWELIALDYIFGYISRKECSDLLGIHDASDIKRRQCFRNVMKGAGVEDFSNKIDFVSGWGESKRQLSPGERCGWVRFANGEKRWIFYKAGIIKPTSMRM